MESQFGSALNGVAGVIEKKWFAAMGLVGLIAFVTSLFVDLPTDRTITTCITLIMMGWGFGQTECRTFRENIWQHPTGRYKITSPSWRLTVTGAIMFAIAIGAAIKLAVHLLAQW